MENNTNCYQCRCFLYEKETYQLVLENGKLSNPICWPCGKKEIALDKEIKAKNPAVSLRKITW